MTSMPAGPGQLEIPPEQAQDDAKAVPPEAPERRGRARSVSVVLLLILAIFYTVYLAKPFLLAIAFAWLLKAALVSPVRFLHRIGLPSPMAALLVVLSSVVVVAVLVMQLATPAFEFIEAMPANLDRLRDKFAELRTPFDGVTRITTEVENLATSRASQPLPGVDAPVPVRVTHDTNLIQHVFSGAWLLAANAAITIVLLFFMLANDEAFLIRAVESVPRLSDKKVVVGTVRSIEGQLSSYISTISMINVVFGAAVAGVMALIGVENPILLGCLAAALNFLPFLGALTMIVCLAATSLLQHDGFSGALLPPVAYLILHLIESWVVSPLLLGKRFTLNPVILFIWLLLWTWLWGIPGALLAVPLLVTLKIVCENIPTLQAYKTFLE